MKKLPFRKVKIVRAREEVEYCENSASFSDQKGVEAMWTLERKGLDWDKCPDKYMDKYNKCMSRYRKSLKKPGKKLNLEKFKWFVVDVSTDEEIARFDSIDQAKRFCVKNDYDFGLWK